ncbi:hypothetical protein LLEC1_04828, partial [Akanthomyces lecanii]
AIFDHLPLKQLLKATIVCRQIYIPAVYALHLRLLTASSIPNHELILECYHPSLKISTPYLSCRYLGTRHPTDGGVDVAMAAAQKDRPDLHDVCQLYASFRPVVTEENRRRRFRMVWPVSVQGGPPAAFLGQRRPCRGAGPAPRQRRALLAALRRAQPRRAGPPPRRRLRHPLYYERARRARLPALAGRHGGGEQQQWRTVGLRFHVSLSPAEGMPLLLGRDEDPAASYGLAYQELLIRSTSLLLAVEASMSKELESSRNSIILSSAST